MSWFFKHRMKEPPPPPKEYRHRCDVLLPSGETKTIEETFFTDYEYLTAHITGDGGLIVCRGWRHPDTEGEVGLECFAPSEWRHAHWYRVGNKP